MTELTSFHDYLETQRPFIMDTLDKVIGEKRENMKFGAPDEIGNSLTDVLSFYLNPDLRERRDQIVALGFTPKLTTDIDFNGTQKNVAFRVVKLLLGQDEEHIHSFATKLKSGFEKLLG